MMKNVEDIYPLSPMQQGMLFHTLYAPQSGAYVMHVTGTLPPRFDVRAFRRAWEQLIAHYPVLRTSFVWERLDEPLQVVRRQVRLVWEELDWGSLAPAEQQERIGAYCRADRKRGFDLARAPLMRLACISMGDDVNYFIWSYHHIILDGWSLPLLFSNLFTLYEANCRGEELRLPPSRPYREYIAWLGRQDAGAAEAFWQELLADFSAPTPLACERPASAGESEAAHLERQATLPDELTRSLQAFTRRHRVTLNTLVQGAWSLLLGLHGGGRDVVFGTTVAGRPAALPGVESMVGLFINVLPMRVRLDPGAALVPWLGELQRRQLEMRRFDYCPLTSIQRSTSVPRGHPLFNSVLTFENFPVTDSLVEQSRSLGIDNVRDATMNNFPLTLIAVGGGGLSLRMVYDPARFAPETIDRLLGQFIAVLEAFTAQPSAALGTFQEKLAGMEKSHQASEQKKRDESNLSLFKRIKPKAVRLPTQSLVRMDYLSPGERLPLVVEPAVEDLDVASWVASNREFVESSLLQSGAVLFRGCQLNTPAAFERLAQAMCPELFGEYGDLPRESAGGKIYGSTPYPPDQSILFHNESSHTDRWPMKIFFYCVKAAEQGGETPLVDCRKVCHSLDPSITRRFREKHLTYVRNYTDSLDVSWQEFFHTDDRAAVEAYCRRAGMEFEWRGANGLRTKKLCQAVARHPKTGAEVFFNQIQLHHIAYLHPTLRESLLALFSEDEFPRHVYYGDGSPIEEGVVEEVLGVYREQARSFPWQEGDVLMLDNMLTAHGRNPFTGQRKILVAMGELVEGRDVASATGGR